MRQADSDSDRHGGADQDAAAYADGDQAYADGDQAYADGDQALANRNEAGTDAHPD